MIQVVAIEEGGIACNAGCPYYTEKGWIQGVREVPIKTNCRMVMNPWMFDCDQYNPKCMYKIKVSKEEWKQMQKAIGKRAIHQRKLYPEEHENANEVGCEWTRSKGRFNAEKSGKVKKV